MSKPRRDLWESPTGVYVDLPQTSPSPDQWREELDDLLAKPTYRGRPHKPEAVADYRRYIRALYADDAPAREFVGFVWSEEDREAAGYGNEERTYVRIQAQSGYDARRAVLTHFGPGYEAWIVNREQLSRKR